MSIVAVPTILFLLSPGITSAMNDYYDSEYYDESPLSDDEYPDEQDDEGDLETEPCPNCGKEVYEEALRCPYCGEYIIRAAGPMSGRPTWWIILGILGIIAFVLYSCI